MALRPYFLRCSFNLSLLQGSVCIAMTLHAYPNPLIIDFLYIFVYYNHLLVSVPL